MIEEVILEKPERFEDAPKISKEKLQKAVEIATDKIEKNLSRFTNFFTPPSTTNFIYEQSPNSIT